MATAAASSQVGQLFGLPGITRWTEQQENNDQLAFTPASGSQKSVTGIIPFKQTDVILSWRCEVNIGATYAAGTTTLNLSQYFPYNFLGPIKLNFQNQWSPVDVINGIDAAIFQSYRPWQYGEALVGRGLLDTSYATMPYSAQVNSVSKSNFTTGSTNFFYTVDLPASQWFDRFWNLDAQGRILSGAPLRMYVSPQFMAGSSRIIQPQITANGLVTSGAGPADVFPVYGSGTQTTPASVSGVSGTLGFQRIGIYQPQGAQDSPVLVNWQYSRISRQYSIAGRTVIDLLLPINGQILSVFVRFYDPSANVLSTVAYGAPIAINTTNFSKFQLLYGSGLYRYQDTPLRVQERFARQHGFLPPEGVIVWDMAQDEQGLITNEKVLNTLNTSGVTVHVECPSALSSTAYAVVGVEALTYVEVP